MFSDNRRGFKADTECCCCYRGAAGWKARGRPGRRRRILASAPTGPSEQDARGDRPRKPLRMKNTEWTCWCQGVVERSRACARLKAAGKGTPFRLSEKRGRPTNESSFAWLLWKTRSSRPRSADGGSLKSTTKKGKKVIITRVSPGFASSVCCCWMRNACRIVRETEGGVTALSASDQNGHR